MRKGTFIYRDLSPYLFLGITLLLFGGIWGLILCDPESLATMPIKDFVILGVFTLVFLAASLAIIKSEAHRPGFYREGIGVFEQDQLLEIIPYAYFQEVRCRHETHRRDGHSHRRYYLDFKHLDGSVMVLKAPSLKKLKHVWREIVRSEPEMAFRLSTPSSNAINQHIYDKLNLVSEQLIEAQFGK